MGALWQRVGAEPIRQTHQGTLYKRDRDRLAEDPVLACPIADALKPLARLPELWLELACQVGLVERDPSGERLLAAAAEFWTDNAVHLPQMIATGWLGLQAWQELRTGVRRGQHGRPGLAVSFALPCCFFWRRSANRSGPPLDDLASQLSDALAGMGSVVVRGAARDALRPPRARADRAVGPRPGRAGSRVRRAG